MNKWDLINRIKLETGFTHQEVYDVIQKYFNYVVESLIQGEKVIVMDFGVFYVKTRKAHKGRNPKKPEEGIIIVPEQPRVKFRPSKELREQVKQLNT